MNPHHPTPPSRHRFHLLDALRGLAAIMVVDVHTAPLIGNVVLARAGHLAVDFFFCLSGFVIAFSYERRLHEGLSIRTFLTARFIRLYPMIFFALIIALLKPAILQLHASDFTVLKSKSLIILQSAFLIPNLTLGWNRLIYPPDNAMWSLFFEAIANLVFAFAAFRRRLHPAALLTVFAASTAIIVIAVQHHVDIIWMGSQSGDYRFVLGFPRVFAAFAAGILVHRFYRRIHTPTTDAISPTLRGTLTLITTSALLFFFLAPLASMRTLNFDCFIIALVLPALVFLGSLARVPAALQPLCAVLGEVSYPLYLLHIVINYTFARNAVTLIQHHPALHPYMLCAIITTDCLIAFAVWKFIDAPVRKRITRFFNQTSTPSSIPTDLTPGVHHA